MPPSGLSKTDLHNLFYRSLERIAELDRDAPRQRFKLTRFQAAQIARETLLVASRTEEPPARCQCEFCRDATVGT